MQKWYPAYSTVWVYKTLLILHTVARQREASKYAEVYFKPYAKHGVVDLTN